MAQKSGALAKPPSSQATAGASPLAANASPADIQARIAFLQKTSPNDPHIKALQAKLGSAPGQQQQQPGDQPAQGATFNSVNGQATAGLSNTLGQIQAQGAFNPGSFKDTQDAAQKAAYDSFESENQPVFDQQQKQLDDQAAARGVPRDSEEYKTMEQNLQSTQQQSRQTAEDQSYGAGLAAEQQQFGQAYQTFQAPYQDASIYNPEYLQEGQQSLQTGAEDWQGNQNDRALANSRTIAQTQAGAQTGAASIAGAATTGAASIYGSSSLAGINANIQGQYGLQANSFAQQMALLAQQMGYQQQPNPGNAAISGISQGIGAGIGSSLTR